MRRYLITINIQCLKTCFNYNLSVEDDIKNISKGFLELNNKGNNSKPKSKINQWERNILGNVKSAIRLAG